MNGCSMIFLESLKSATSRCEFNSYGPYFHVVLNARRAMESFIECRSQQRATDLETSDLPTRKRLPFVKDLIPSSNSWSRDPSGKDGEIATSAEQL